MADGKSINDEYNKRHLLRLKLYQKRVEALLDAATKDCAALGITLKTKLKKDKPFTFDDFPNSKKKFDDIIQQVAKGLLAAVVNGVNAEWELANDKNDKLADKVFSRLRGQLTDDEKKLYYKNNRDALEAFRNRVTAGMNLSDKVWKYTSQYKNEIELALDCGLRDGVAATKLASELKQYLQYPDKLFRRVRDEHGILHLSKAAAAFHPSTGVYRSSYKNALRLARTETNMAYRAADHTRYQQLYFVLGIQIHLSNNHTCLGRDGKPHPFTDICDELQGVYPKDFKFVGWHPQCRCFVTSILMSDEEVDKARAARRAGKEYHSPNEIKDVPDAFKQYLKDHKASIDKAANKPYWCMDNYKYTGYGEPPAPPKPTPAEIAAQRHAARTPEQIKEIKKAWEYRKNTIAWADTLKDNLGGISDIDLSKLYELDRTAQWKELRAECVKLDGYRQELLSLDYIGDGLDAAKTYGYQAVMDAEAAIGKKIDQFKSSCTETDYDSMTMSDLDHMIKRLKFEANYVEHPEQYGKSKLPTWKLAQDAYLNDLAKAENARRFLVLKDKLNNWLNLNLNDSNLDQLLDQFNDYLLTKRLDEAEALIPDIEDAVVAAGGNSSGAITLPTLTDDEIDALLDDYKTNTTDEMDGKLRPQAEQSWKGMSHDDKWIMTKYTQTFHYLNEPLRNITRGSIYSRNDAAFQKEMPMLQSALSMQKLPVNMVARRGTGDYYIPELGKNLSQLKAGDTYTDGAFLSVAVHRNKGLYGSYEMVIVIPQGAQGMYAEPFSHYNGSKKEPTEQYDYIDDRLWDGSKTWTIAAEQEWIGQRGSRFEVIKVDGHVIYLKMIGQLYEQP